MIKKIFLLIISLLFLFNITCFATSSETLQDSNSGDIYINSYDEYQQIVNGEDDEANEQLKVAYEEYQNNLKDYYNSYEREKTYKARVVEVQEVKENYEYNQYYYTVTKYVIQPITVEVLEGEHMGERFEINYLLTGDSLNNIQYSEVEVGDTIFVGFYTDETTGEVMADITNTGSNIERLGIVVCIGVAALIVLIIYGGRKGLLKALIALLILDFCLVIIPSMGFEGQGFVISTIGLIVALAITIPATELGINKKSLLAGILAVVSSIVSVVLVIALNHLTRTTGIVFEFAAVSENVLLGNMNFESLFIMITCMISTLLSTIIICQTIRKIDETKAEDFNERLNKCKEILNSKILVVVMITFALYIPNHLLLLTNKYTSQEIWNSEILVSELVRMFVVLITMAIAMPSTIAVYKLKQGEKTVDKTNDVEENESVDKVDDTDKVDKTKNTDKADDTDKVDKTKNTDKTDNTNKEDK